MYTAATDAAAAANVRCSDAKLTATLDHTNDTLSLSFGGPSHQNPLSMHAMLLAVVLAKTLLKQLKERKSVCRRLLPERGGN